MMLDTDYKVRMKLSDGKAYVNHLDVQAMRWLETFHNSTEERKFHGWLTTRREWIRQVDHPVRLSAGNVLRIERQF